VADVLFTHTGDFFRIPGIPYGDRFQVFQPVVYDGIPEIDQLRQLVDQAPYDTMVSPWPRNTLLGFRDFVPTTYKRMTSPLSEENLQAWFGDSHSDIPDEKRVLLQLQTENDSKGATIDSLLINHRWGVEVVANKAHLLNRLYNIGRLYGHVPERDNAPFLFGDLTQEHTWPEAIIAMKQMFLEFMEELPLSSRPYDIAVRGVEVTPEQLRTKYSYLETFKSMLGDDLVAVLNYGSAARTDDPARYSDFDNWLVVRDVPRALRIFNGTCPFVHEGKVHLNVPEHLHPKDSKHLGMFFMPDSPEFLRRYVQFKDDSIEFLLHTKVLYGELEFPIVSQDEVMERGMSAAYTKLKSLQGSISWPDKLLGKPPLFEFFVKICRFYMRPMLNILEKPWYRPKEVLDKELLKRGIKIPKYVNDVNKLREGILYALHHTFRLQEEFFQSGRKSSLAFMSDQQYIPTEDIIDQRDINWRIKRNPVRTLEQTFTPKVDLTDPKVWFTADAEETSIRRTENVLEL